MARTTRGHRNCSPSLTTRTRCFRILFLACLSISTHHSEAFSLRSNQPSSFVGKAVSKRPLFLPHSTTTTTNSLSMHMGHSHSHHTHVHTHDDDEQGGSIKSRLAKIKTRRLAAMFLFCAAVTLGPSVVWRHSVRRADFAAFSMMFTCFGFFNVIRRGVKDWILKIQKLHQGFLKHQPKTKFSLRKYLLANENAADRVTLLGVAINLVLSLGKFAVGVTCHSSALVADAGHSLSDLFSDFVTLYSVQIARLPPDDDHPYGHGKFEAIGSLFLALTLLGTGISVGTMANKQLVEILSMQKSGIMAAAAKIPKAPALIMAALSIVSKEWLFRITRKVGESLNSQVVIANAWHHRSDAYSSVLALGSIALAMTVPGLVAADAAAGLLVAGMICMTGAEILGESINQLSDRSNDDLVHRVQKIASDHDDVLHVNRIRTRQVGSSSVVDVSVVTPEALSSSAIRTVEQRIRQRILEEEPDFVSEAEVRGLNYNPRLDQQQHQQQPQQQQQQVGTGGELQSSEGSMADGSSNGIDGQGATNTLGTPTDPNQQLHSALDCPLLVSMSNHGTDDECPSASQVESTARELTMSSSFDPDTISLRGVTVHYDDPFHAIVDVDIRLASQQQSQPQDSTTDSDMSPNTIVSVDRVQDVANQLRERLESSPSIHKANIYLDLNSQHDNADDTLVGSSSDVQQSSVPMAAAGTAIDYNSNNNGIKEQP